jgi:hypothetical protein
MRGVRGVETGRKYVTRDSSGESRRCKWGVWSPRRIYCPAILTPSVHPSSQQSPAWPGYCKRHIKWGCAAIHQQVLSAVPISASAHKPGERTRTETETERVEREPQPPVPNASESINRTPPQLSFLPSSSPSPLQPPPLSPPPRIFHERLYRRSCLIFLCQSCISGGHGYRHSSGNLPNHPIFCICANNCLSPSSQM